MSCFFLHQLPLLRQNFPSASVSCLAQTKTVPSCGFPCKCSVSWNLGWWIMDKSTWEGWGVCSQKKLPEENGAFNNLEGWAGHEVSLAFRASILGWMAGGVQDSSPWTLLRKLQESPGRQKNPLIAACYSLTLGRHGVQCGTTGVLWILGEQHFSASQGCPQLLCLSIWLFCSQVLFLH